ncbi:MAG: glycosyltransferase family 2 protein [Proteobacteria bacterium]|nr:glycosyltransferase family 2 protein [Pseudomonadota bacterium]
MKAVIIIPTYNECENIGHIIDKLQNEFRSINHDMNILVVDDSSPDGTANIVWEKMQTATNVYLIKGQKAGLGAAYIRGMTYAVQQLDSDVIFEMDADFSHDPKDVPRLLAEIEAGYDFVIGSRYVPGGSIPSNWGRLRKMNSYFGNIVARYLAGIYRVRDCTAGFRAIRSSLLKELDLASIKTQGYGFQVTLLYEAVIHQAKVKEIPVDFIDREKGESKLDLKNIIEFMVNAWGIRLRGSANFLKFCTVGLLGLFVNLISFTYLMNLGYNKFFASPFAIEISIISNFLLNNFWTFRNKETKDNIYIRGLKFNLVSLISLLVSYTSFILLSHIYTSIMPQILQGISIVPATLINYFCNAYWTFSNKKRDRLLQKENELNLESEQRNRKLAIETIQL